MTKNASMYRIFVLDDNEGQLNTIQAILEDEGFDVYAFLRVNDAFDFLKCHEVDVAIFDLRMPEITELELIEKVRPIADRIPVIINTAYGSFDTAKKAVNVGAFAYLEKAGDPGFLIREVNRAIYNRLEKTKELLEIAVRERTYELELEIEKRKEIEDALRESEKKYRLIAENSSDVIWIADITERKLTYVSPSVFGLRGFTPQESMEQNFIDSIVPEKREILLKMISQGVEDLKKGNSGTYTFEVQQYCKDGSLVWVEMTARSFINSDNGHIEVHGSSRNISKRKEAEFGLKVSEDRFRAISEYSHNAICIVDEQGKIIWANQALLNLLGVTSEQIYAVESIDVFVAPESVDWVVENFRNFVSQKDYVHHCEFFVINARGEKLLIEKNMTDFVDVNGRRNLAISMLDITRQRLAQRELDNSHAELSAIYNSIPVAILIIDKEKKIYKTNKVTSEIANCVEADIIAKRCGEIFSCVNHLDSGKGCGYTPSCSNCVVDNSLNETLKTRKSISNAEALIVSVVNKENKYNWFLISTSFVELNNEEYVLLSAQDITSRKLIEQQLVESETRYRNLFEKNSAVMLIIDPETATIIDVNAAALKYYDYTPQQMQNISIFEINTSAKRTVRDRIQNVLNHKEKHFFSQHKLANGQIRDVEIFSGPVQQGNKMLLYSIVFDVSDKKKYEEALINSELRFRTFMNSTSDLIFIKDQQLRYIYSNQANAAFLGKSPEDLIGLDDFSLMTAEAARKCRETDTYSLQSYKIMTNEEVVGDNVYETTKFPVQLPDGQIGLGGIIRDISDRYFAFQTIKENERRLSMLMGNLQGMVYRCMNNRQWTMLFVSDGCKELTGYNPEDLIDNAKISFNDLIHPDFRDDLWNKWQIQLKSKDTFTDEYIIVTKSGEHKWVYEKGAGVFDENDNLIALEGFISDITSLKQAEDALRDSEVRYRTLVETSPSGIAIIDTDAKIVFGNTRLIEMFGYSTLDDIVNVDILNWITDDTALSQIGERKNAFLRLGRIENFRLNCRHKSGKMIPVEVNITVLKSALQSDWRIVVVFQDITFRINAENKLKFNTRVEKTMAETLEFVSKPETTIGEIALNIASNMATFLGNPFIIVSFFPELIVPDPDELQHPVSSGCFISGDLNLIYPINTLHPMYLEMSVIIRKLNKSTLYAKLPVSFDKEDFRKQYPEFRNLMIVPVKVNDKKMGFIMLSDMDRKLSHEDQEIAERFSSIFAIALQRELIQRELKDVNNKFLQLAENISGVFVILSRNFRKLQYINSACTEMLGISLDEMYRKPFGWLSHVHTSDIALLRKFFRDLQLSGAESDSSLEFRYRKGKSSLIWLQVTVFPIFNERGEVIRFAGTVFDVTERKNMQIIEMTALIRGENSERQRFAQELHDGLGPLMSTLRMYMQAIARAEDKLQLSRFSEMSEKLFLEATRTLSEISNNISPHILTNFGLKEAIRNFVEKITNIHQTQINLICTCEKRFGQLIESTIYRVICELINNSIKHGEATEITLDLDYLDGLISINYSDNGKGFDVDKTLKESKGMGLSNIANRIQNIQGVVTFTSVPNKGFLAHIEIEAEAEDVV